METNRDNGNLFKREKGLGFALLLILIGGIYLLFNLNIIPIEYKPILISWQTLLIVLGVWALLRNRYTSGIVLIAIGGFFIYPTLCRLFPGLFICFDIDAKTYWPLLLIILGLILVMSRFFPKKVRHHKRRNHYKVEYSEYKEKARQSGKEESIDFIDKNVMFGSTEQIVLSQNLRGGEANVMFGELIIDLRHAQLAEVGGFLEVNVMFGSVVIYIPADWSVELQGNSILGSFEDKRYQIGKIQEIAKNHLVIEGCAMFGSGEIRN